MKKNTLMILAFSAVPFIMVLGNSMLIPEFPAIKKTLDISQFEVGLFITIFSLSAGLTIPLLGYISDQIGRKKVIIPALLLYGTGGIISGTAALLLDQPFIIILIGRGLQGIGAAGTAPIVMALVGDLFQSEKRSEVLGILEAANGIGKVVSPVLGAAIGLISWIALFFFYAFLAIPIAIGVWVWGREKHKPQKQGFKPYLQEIIKIFKNKGFSLLATISAGMLALFCLFGLLSYFSDLLEVKYHIQGLSSGLIIAIPILFMSITSYFDGLLLKKIKKYYKVSILTGLSLIPAVLFILNFIEALYLYVFFFSLLGIGTGLILPAINTLVTSSTASNQRGIITSIYGSARFLGVAAGPPVFSFLEEINLSLMYFGSSGIAVIILILAAIFIKEKGMTPPKKN